MRAPYPGGPNNRGDAARLSGFSLRSEADPYTDALILLTEPRDYL